MLERIPELAARVPCSCGNRTLAECYRGACPPQYGPCNGMGRDVYPWQQPGLSDDAIVARVRARYPRP